MHANSNTKLILEPNMKYPLSSYCKYLLGLDSKLKAHVSYLRFAVLTVIDCVHYPIVLLNCWIVVYLTHLSLNLWSNQISGLTTVQHDIYLLGY